MLIEEHDKSSYQLSDEQAMGLRERLADEDAPTLTRVGQSIAPPRRMKIVIREEAAADPEATYAWEQKEGC